MRRGAFFALAACPAATIMSPIPFAYVIGRMLAPEARKMVAHGVSRGYAVPLPPSRGSGERSIQHETRIIVDMVEFQERDELFLERNLVMMLHLILDVSDHFAAIGIAYRKS